MLVPIFRAAAPQFKEMSPVVFPATLQGWSSVPPTNEGLELKGTQLSRITKQGTRRAGIGGPFSGSLLPYARMLPTLRL